MMADEVADALDHGIGDARDFFEQLARRCWPLFFLVDAGSAPVLRLSGMDADVVQDGGELERLLDLFR